jgi:hypothetical protein
MSLNIVTAIILFRAEGVHGLHTSRVKENNCMMPIFAKLRMWNFIWQ